MKNFQILTVYINEFILLIHSKTITMSLLHAKNLIFLDKINILIKVFLAWLVCRGSGQCQHLEPHPQCRGLVGHPSSWSCTSRRLFPFYHCGPRWEQSRSKERKISGVSWWHGFWSFWLNPFYNMFNQKLNSKIYIYRMRLAEIEAEG